MSAPARFRLPTESTPERRLLRRLLLVITLYGVIFCLFWWDREGLRDHNDGHISFGDVAYFTAVTVTTLGYGDIVPVSAQARWINTLLVTPLRLVIWLIFLGTAYELVLQRWMETRRMRLFQQELKDHLIICGYGHSGRSAAMEARSRNMAEDRILVMDRDPAKVEAAARDGFLGLTGDPTREQDLADAAVARSKAVLVCVGRDDTAVLAVLTVRQMHPKLRIICNVAEEENAKLLRQAGADALILPSKVGGFLMADSVQSSHIADYVSDLMSSGGRVQLLEREVRPEEHGLHMREFSPGMAVRLIRDGRPIGFWEGEEARVRAGDLLLVIEPSAEPEC